MSFKLNNYLLDWIVWPVHEGSRFSLTQVHATFNTPTQWTKSTPLCICLMPETSQTFRQKFDTLKCKFQLFSRNPFSHGNFVSSKNCVLHKIVTFAEDFVKKLPKQLFIQFRIRIFGSNLSQALKLQRLPINATEIQIVKKRFVRQASGVT